MSGAVFQVYRDYPDYVCTQYYNASLLLYRLTLTVQALEKRDLSIISQFILEALSLGVETVDSVARVLGLDVPDLAHFAADLLATDLIEQGGLTEEGQRRIALTKKGQKVLADKEQMAALTVKEYSLHFNTLTKTLEPRWAETTRGDVARKRGEYALPKKADKPSIAEIDMDSVRSALEIGRELEPDLDLLSVIGLASSGADYATGIEVFVLRERHGHDEQIVAFYKGTRQQGLSVRLSQLHADRETVIPDDAFTFNVASVSVQHFLPPAIAPLAQAHMDYSGQITALQHEELARVQAMSALENEEERQSMARRIQTIRSDVATLKEDRSTTVQRIQQQVSAAPRPVDGRAYRDAVRKALDHATGEIILVARHMAKQAMDDELCAAIAQAAKRSVAIWIGYDARHGRRRGDGSRVYQATFAVRRTIEQFAAPEQSPRLPNVQAFEIDAIPANILVCDRTFGLVSNFDLFAFSSSGSGAFAPPQGLVFTDPATVEAISRAAMELFPQSRA